jgi:DNA-binding MarR family transcriptional regulator
MWQDQPMTMDVIYSKPGHLIRRAHQIVVGMFMEECAEFDITPVQYGCLAALHEHPGIDATRISYLIAFDRSTLGQVLERLETKGLIQRTGSPHDKRVKLVKLTREGARLLAAVEPCVNRAMKRLLGRLPLEEQRNFMRTLTLLVELNNEYSRAPLRVVSSNE